MEKEWVSVILERGKCYWGKCYFCGWGKIHKNQSIENLMKKFIKALEKGKGKYGVKIFCSGSFLDSKQFPLDFVKWCIEKARKCGFKEIIIESRPEFIKDEILEKIKVEGIKITVAIGLEIADNEILLKYYNKGFTVEDYMKAVEKLRKYGFGVRTYVLVNGHPFLYQNKELQKELLDKTMKLLENISDSIVIINAYPHKYSKLLEDWCKCIWKPLDEKEFMNLVKDYVNHPKVEIDFNNFNFIPRFPKEMQEFIKGAKIENIIHPHFKVWQDYLVRFYTPPKNKEYCLFIPCSYKKPYYRSKTFKAIVKTLSKYPFFEKLHFVVVSNPGVIPREFFNYYPFNSYDWPEWEETEEVMKFYIKVTKERVKNYVLAHKDHYKHYFAYFHLHSETLEAIKEAFDEIGMQDKLTIILDEDTYKKIVEEIGKKSASIVRHKLALRRLEEVLTKFLD